MSEKFNPGAGDRLLDRAEQDETGELKRLVADLIEVVKRMSKEGIPIDEIAATTTMAWYIGQNPELEGLIGTMISLNAADENSYN